MGMWYIIPVFELVRYLFGIISGIYWIQWDAGRFL